MNALDLLVPRTIHSGSWGNLQYEEFPWTLANGDANPSTHDLVKLPQYLKIVDSLLVITDATNATVTLSVGLKSVSGVNQDSAAYFHSAVAGNALTWARKSTTGASIKLQQDMYLRLTVGGAAVTEGAAGYVGLWYIWPGAL